MQEPRPCVIRHKANGDVVCGKSNVDRITPDRVEIVILRCPGMPHDIKGVLDRLSSPGICVNLENLPRAGGTDAIKTINRECIRQESTYWRWKELCWEGYFDDLVWWQGVHCALVGQSCDSSCTTQDLQESRSIRWDISEIVDEKLEILVRSSDKVDRNVSSAWVWQTWHNRIVACMKQSFIEHVDRRPGPVLWLPCRRACIP